MEVLLIIAGIILISLWSWGANHARISNLYYQLKPRLDTLDKEESRLQQDQAAWEKQVKLQRESIASEKLAIEVIAREKSLGFPWLAQAYADYYKLKDLSTADYLEWKSHPAMKAAEHVREISHKRHQAEKLSRILKYQIDYYENLFPWLIDFKGEDLDDLIRQIVEKRNLQSADDSDNDDPAKHWLTEAEYASLSTSEKYQLALDRYCQKKKTKWEIGRDYERYIGYRYESLQYEVTYQGILEGFSDLGRDLICKTANSTEIIQCKYWTKERQIHEKHIFQLYGTCTAYKIDHPGERVIARFITSTGLTDRANQFAQHLGIQIEEYCALERYPSVKCNVSFRSKEKIYHLPFDQQYDRTMIQTERNEHYAWTIREAEALGFRRAFRWSGQKNTT